MKKLTIEDAHNLANSRGFKFLSLEFKNTTTKHLWGCAKGHEWITRYHYIKTGTGCPFCANVVRKTTTDAHHLAESMGFKFLSPEFINTRTKHHWECSQGHKWSAPYTSIQQGIGCPHCSNNVRKTITDAQNLAEKRGFIFLSTEFYNTKTKYTWECNAGHYWQATYNDIDQNRGCRKCAFQSKKRSIENAHDIAQKRGLTFLSTEFDGVNNKYLWGCNQGHKWLASYSCIKRGSGCPDCNKKNIDDAHHLAESMGFKFLSPEFINTRTKHHWECSQGHKWSATYSDIKQNSGCPECSDNTKGEKLTRYCFEKILQCDFKKIRPNWMRNPQTNYRLELDGYNEDLQIAFEHQGLQHEKDCRKSYYYYDPEVLIRDEIKRQKCKERGIILIEVPEIGRRLKVKNVVPFLLSEFDKHNIAYPESAKSFQIDMKEFYAEYMNQKSTTGVDDFLSELDAMDFSDASLFEDSIVDEVNNLDFDDPELFN
jgi:hypothetical protein